jgi:Tropinone reductase 1
LSRYSQEEVLIVMASWSLGGRNYVVTGGSRGIGFATARCLLEKGAARVLLCARSAPDCQRAVTKLMDEFSAGQTIIGTSCDISTIEGRATLVQEASIAFGLKGLHGLVNNVGVNMRKTVLEQTSEEYYTMMRTNIDSAYFLCRDLFSLFDVEGGTIVNVSSAAGVQSSGTGAAYGMSKAALIQYSKILACEWAQYKIRVNVVAPWMVMTPMLQEAIASNPSQLDKVYEWTPMHRLGTVEEMAAPIVFLCMPCSSYITGQCLGIDGGLTAQGFDGPCITPP